MPPSVPLGARTPRPSPCRHSPSSQPPSPTSSEERSAHLRPPQLPPNSAALPSERPSGRAPQPPPVESSTTSGRCRSFSPSESAGRPAPQLASLAAAEGEELVLRARLRKELGLPSARSTREPRAASSRQALRHCPKGSFLARKGVDRAASHYDGQATAAPAEHVVQDCRHVPLRFPMDRSQLLSYLVQQVHS